MVGSRMAPPPSAITTRCKNIGNNRALHATKKVLVAVKYFWVYNSNTIFFNSTLVSNMDSTDELKRRYNAPVFESIDELLESNVACEVDGIIISAPHAEHFNIGLKSIAAGYHILMEKVIVAQFVLISNLFIHILLQRAAYDY